MFNVGKSVLTFYILHFQKSNAFGQLFILTIEIKSFYCFFSLSHYHYAGAESAEMYRNNVPNNNNYGMSSNLVNGHHHDMQMNSFGQSAVTNGYGMSLKQEPDVSF